jgi:hypothetical protein
MKFLMLIKHAENFKREDVPPQLFEAMGEFVTANLKSGVILETAGLRPTRDGFRVRLDSGKLTVTDGPFVETKEVVGGYALVEATSRDHALQVAREFMDLHRIHFPAFDGECEVRPLEGM